jgi:hypothetical protein
LTILWYVLRLLGMKTFAPEFANVTAFATFLADDDREDFTHEDLLRLNMATACTVAAVRSELESYGFRLAVREPEKRVRGFNTNSNDRWYGPGACRSHGGSGGEQITGFAGRKG